MKKALMIVCVLAVAVISTACINNIAVQELNNKAAEFMQKGDYDAAINRLESSLDLDSSMYQTYYNLGIASINAKKYEKAVNAFEGGIKVNPDFADFYYSLGVAQIELADEIMEPKEDEEESAEVTEQKEEKKKEVSDEDKSKAVELKTSAIANLNKFLQMVPDAQSKETIEEMIKQSEEFILGDEKKETEE